jgi:signal transduction histidine kinase
LRNGDSISRAECLWSIQADGETVTYDLRMSASAIIISGNPLVLLALEDTAPMKQLETRDREIEKLSLALQMARATTHELNQPLSVLVGNLDLLANQGEVDGPLKDRIDRVSRSADRVVETVRRLQGIISSPKKGTRLKTGPANSAKATLIA